MENQKQKQKHNYIRSIMNFLQGIAFTIFVFAIILVMYLIIIYRTRLTPFVNYAIVFDAGSSHTEMFVYSWPADKSNGLGTTSTVNQYFVCQLNATTVNDTVKTGESKKLKAISDFEQNVDSLEEYFRPCLTKAIAKIPSNRHRLSPIFLGATAGMRLLRLRNAARAKQVLESIREIFSNTPFQFVVARQVRILTGIEEAIDGWITTNILLEKFKHRHAQKIHPQDELDTDMVGVLDLGGASTQVTFTYPKTINDEPIPDEFTANITLFDAVYNPYAHSYLCWGKSEALQRHRARLVNAAINSNRAYSPDSTNIFIHDPCLARGANDTFKINNIFRSVCTANEKQKLNNYINPSSIIFIGAGKASECRQQLISLFDAKRNDKTVNCSFKQEYCTFDHTFQPKISQKIRFIGLSGYYYVFSNLAYGMTEPKGSPAERYKFADFPQEKIDQRLINVCETNYSILYQQEGMNSSTEPYKRSLCFDAWYMWLLLTHAIGFQQDDLQRLTFADTFPTGKVGWTLGYMINQTNYIPAEYRERIITKNSFIGWLSGSLTIALITFIFLLLTCYTYYKQRPTITVDNKDGFLQPHEQEMT